MPAKPVIESIQSKVERVLRENSGLRQENRTLEAANRRLKAANKELAEKLTEKERTAAVDELSRGLSEVNGNRRQARARVNRLMREIDRCIALLAAEK